MRASECQRQTPVLHHIHQFGAKENESVSDRVGQGFKAKNTPSNDGFPLRPTNLEIGEQALVGV
jgi:hypothetical protein